MKKIYVFLAVFLSFELHASEQSLLLNQVVSANCNTMNITRKNVSFVQKDSEGFDVMLHQSKSFKHKRSGNIVVTIILESESLEQQELGIHHSSCFPKILCCAVIGAFGYLTYFLIEKFK